MQVLAIHDINLILNVDEIKYSFSDAYAMQELVMFDMRSILDMHNTKYNLFCCVCNASTCHSQHVINRQLE